MRHRVLTSLLIVLAVSMIPALAAAPAPAQKWVTVWTASAHGPYPLGNPSAQPDQKFAFPVPEAGADDQTFRLIARPDLWGTRMRLRFSNVFGSKALELSGVHIGLQALGGRLVHGTNRPVTFGGTPRISIPAGQSAWTDPVDVPFGRSPRPELDGRKLAVSFHASGPSGPMTWHAKALTTSYVSPPRSGDVSGDESDAKFPYTTASWFFLDAIDVMAPAETALVVCFGDSITDGTGSTMNGDDRWPDVLSQRLHAAYGSRIVVVNAGIGGNRVVGPAGYDRNPAGGGPGALDRLDRDVLALSGVTAVIWMEGINDLGAANASAAAVIDGYRQGLARMKAKGLKVIGGTLTSALNSSNGAYGTPELDQRRRAVNNFIRTAGAFDAVADFDAATLDPGTGEIRPEFQPNSTIGGAGDKLHPNRAGYLAMANAVDLTVLRPSTRPHD